MYWSVFVVFTHYVQFVPQYHAMHTLSTLLAEWKKQNLFTPPKGEFVQHVTHSGHGSAAHTVETTSFHIPAPPIVSTQPSQSSSHADWFTILVEVLHERVSRLTNVIYSTNNQVQMRLIAIETQLDEIQRKLEESL